MEGERSRSATKPSIARGERTGVPGERDEASAILSDAVVVAAGLAVAGAIRHRA